MLHATNCGVCATQHSIPCVQLNVQQWLAITSHHSNSTKWTHNAYAPNSFIFTQILNPQCCLFWVIIANITFWHIVIHHSSYTAMQHWYNKTRLHVTKFFGSCTTTMLSHKCIWGKYITIDPCYHNNWSLLGIQLKQSINSETSTHRSSMCQLYASVFFFLLPGPMNVGAHCDYFQGTCTDSAIFCKNSYTKQSCQMS